MLSLFLTVTLLLGCTTANAAEMRVELALSDASAILPLGTTVTVEVKDNGTSAVSLMIVKPDSTQEFRYGREYTFINVMAWRGSSFPTAILNPFPCSTKRKIDQEELINVETNDESAAVRAADAFLCQG